MKYFPIFLKVEKRSIVIFGGGAEAAAKLRLVEKTKAKILVVAQDIDHSVLELGSACWIQQEPMGFALPDDLVLAYAATGHQALDQLLALKVQNFGAVACAIDQIEPSSFTTPAIVDRDPVVVAIGTEGTAPVLARCLKAEIEDGMESELGKIACIAKGLRADVAAMIPSGSLRRRFWSDFFEQARQTPKQASQIGETLLKHFGALKTQPKSSLSLIHAPMGREMLSEEALAKLFQAEIVIRDGGVEQGVLEMARREALHIRDDKKTHQRVRQSLVDGQDVVVIRQKAHWGDLLELSVGFGVLAQIYEPKSTNQTGTACVDKVCSTAFKLGLAA